MGTNTPTCTCGTCKKCKNREYMRLWRKKNPDRVRELKRNSKKTPRGREIIKAYSKRRHSKEEREAENEKVRLRRAADPSKFRAREWVNRSLKRDTIQRLSCEVCGSLKSEAHHEDYSKPAMINWLCTVHHAQREQRNASQMKGG